MKKNQIIELLSKSKEELKTMLKQERFDIAKMQIEKASGRLKDVAEIGAKKKTVARILTNLRYKELIST